jgi:hypothetical protein
VAPTATATELPAPTSVPTLTAADAFQAALARLDSVWGTDWPASIQILDDYLQQYPDQQPATDKLYAALVGYGGDLIDSGSVDDGIAQLERAQSLAPDRQEAQDALLALTPTAEPLATRPPARLLTPNPVRIAATGPLATATPDSGHAKPQPSPTPGRPQDSGATNPAPTATPVKAPTAAPTAVPTRVTVVPTATPVRATPTRATQPTRVVPTPTAVVRAGP